MAGEFEKITEDGYISWKCNACGTIINGKRKPRGHRCFNSMTTPNVRAPTHSTSSAPIYRFGNNPKPQGAPRNAGPSGSTWNTSRGSRPRVSSHDGSSSQNYMNQFIQLFQEQNLQT